MGRGFLCLSADKVSYTRNEFIWVTLVTTDEWAKTPGVEGKRVLSRAQEDGSGEGRL